MTVALFNREVFPFDYCGKALFCVVHMEQISHTERFFHIFIGIDGRNTAPCRAEFRIAQPVLFETVKELVIRHTNRCPITNFKMFRCNFDSRVAQALHLSEEMFNINNHSRSHNVYRFVTENTGGKKIENEFSLLVYNGVSCVIAALITRNDIILFAEKVNHSALSFVAPVDSNNCRKHFLYLTHLFLYLFRAGRRSLQEPDRHSRK